MKNRKLLVLLSVVLSCCLLLCACGAKKTAGTAADASADASAATDAMAAVDWSAAERLGEGERQFYYAVTFADGATKAYDIATDETSVGAALSSLGLVEGEKGSYGLYVKTIGGVRADYNLDGAYWAFYINGEYAMTGVDDTEIADGGEYRFVYTPADQFN